MSRFNDNQGFKLSILLRYVAYAAGILALLWVAGMWRWQPKTYGCFSGWINSYQRQEVLDYGSLHLYVWTVKRDCILGKPDRYDPKEYQRNGSLPATSQP